MSLWLRDLMDRFDQRTLRERVLLLAAVLGLLLLVWDSALMTPLERQNQVRRAQAEALRAEVSGLEQSVEAIVAEGAADPETRGREALQALAREVAALDERLAGATAGLVAPKEMARVLEQLLDRTSRMTLHGLRTLPPQAVMTSAPAGGAGGEAQIYKHGVELELSGTYLEMLGFLQALEALPWRFFWDRVEYQVERHPQGRLKLTLSTLGLEEGWIGV